MVQHFLNIYLDKYKCESGGIGRRYSRQGSNPVQVRLLPLAKGPLLVSRDRFKFNLKFMQTVIFGGSSPSPPNRAKHNGGWWNW